MTESCLQSSEPPNIEYTCLYRYTHANKDDALMQHTFNVYLAYTELITGSYCLFGL